MNADRNKALRAVFLAEADDRKADRAYDLRVESSNVPALRDAFAAAAALPFVAPVEAPGKLLPGLPEQFVTLGESGGLHRVGDEDAGDYSRPMHTKSLRFQARVEATLQEICRDETGQFETEAETQKRREKEARLVEQGHAVCRGLESVGVPAYRADIWKLQCVGVHSGEVTTLPAYRRICLNPYVAHRLRMPFLNWLQFFAQQKQGGKVEATRGDNLRFWTFTTGKRVPIHRVEARLAWLHRRISELNAQPFMTGPGVRIVFRSSELGTLESSQGEAAAKAAGTWQDAADSGELQGGGGGRWYHPHAHCIVWLSRGPLQPWRWEELLRRVWEFWYHQWDDGGRIRDLREAVKYLVKPGDIVRLANEAPAELAKLQAVLFRKKLVQPMADLALDMRAAAVAGLRPVLRWVDGERQAWRLIRDPNRNPIARGSEDSGLKGSDGVAPEWRGGLDDLQVPAPSALSVTKAEKHFARDKYGVKPSQDLDVCRVMARCVPAFNSRGLKEPRVIVCGTNLDLSAVMRHPLVARMKSATCAAYAEGERLQALERGGLALVGESAVRGGSAFRVHTGTPTVEPAAPVFPADSGPLGWDPEIPAEWSAETAPLSSPR
jgi:hypothetical protein